MPKANTSFFTAALFTGAALAGCTSVTNNPDLPTGPAAYDVVPATVTPMTAYQIMPTDVLSVSVFGEADLSTDKIRVDDAGFVQLPLIGQVKAAGRTPDELGNDLADRLGRRYLVDPKVAVSVVEAAKRFVSVEGEVRRPGVYEIGGDFTLLSAIARAESTNDTAKLNEIIIFRTINGTRMAARFNLKDVRSGVAPDPQIMDGDIVVVGLSGAKQLWQDILKAAPIFNVFTVATN